MSHSYFHHQLARSPFGRALGYYIQNGMAPGDLRRLTLHLCYWYQSVNGRQTTALDGHIYRRTRTALGELRYAYILWHQHRHPCRCGCEANNTDLGAFSSVVRLMRGHGWLGEGSEDEFSMDDVPVVSRRRDLRAMADARRTRREQWRADPRRNILLGSLTDERGRRPSRERSANEDVAVLTQSGSQRREELINSRSRSSPPDPPTEQRNTSALSSTDSASLRGGSAHRMSNDRESTENIVWILPDDGGRSRNISTASLMSQIMGNSDASWPSLIRRARESSNNNSRTSRRSRDLSMNNRSMRRSPDLATAQSRERGFQAPSTVHTRRRSGSLDSLMAERVRLYVRFMELLRMMPQAEGSRLSATARDLLLEFEAGPPSHGDMLVEGVRFWRRAALLVTQILAEEGL